MFNRNYQRLLAVGLALTFLAVAPAKAADLVVWHATGAPRRTPSRRSSPRTTRTAPAR
jgi:hypothetical protein